MNFQKHYQTFYENAPAEEARHALKENIAQKTFNKKSPSSMKIFTRVAFAAFVVFVSVPLFAPNAFAETVKFAGQTFTLATEKVQVLITRSFDKDHDLFSDDAVTKLTEDPSVKSLEYTRSESGEGFKLRKECEGEDEDCNFLSENLEINGGNAGELTVEITNNKDESRLIIYPGDGSSCNYAGVDDEYDALSNREIDFECQKSNE